MDREQFEAALLNPDSHELGRADRLDLKISDGVVQVFRLFRRIGELSPEISNRLVELDGLDTWAARTLRLDGETRGLVLSIMLVPFPIKECGCVLNFGGYLLRPCQPHGEEIESVLGEVERCEHRVPIGSGCGICNQEARELKREQETIYRGSVL